MKIGKVSQTDGETDDPNSKQACASKKSGKDILIIPWEMRPFPFDIL